MKLLLAGDTHGDIHRFRLLFQTARAGGCDRIVQLGDFGYWPHMGGFAEHISDLAQDFEIPVCWLDGNHENFDALEQDVDMASPTPVAMSHYLTYLPRGCTWEWDGLRFMAFGGAYSIDKDRRVPGFTWWSQELPTHRQQREALERGQVDVLFTHDAPVGCCPGISPTYKGDEISLANRRWISELVRSTSPQFHAHGHYHAPSVTRHESVLNGVRTLGLDCNQTPLTQHTSVLDLSTLTRKETQAA